MDKYDWIGFVLVGTLCFMGGRWLVFSSDPVTRQEIKRCETICQDEEGIETLSKEKCECADGTYVQFKGSK